MAATNHDLEALIAAGRFREDLFYRLNVIEITLPPLRERRADVLPLAEHLLRFFARQNGKHIAGFSDAVRQAICDYSWPGNIRELRNAVERAAILANEDRIAPDNLPAQVVRGEFAAAVPPESMTLEQLEAEHIRRVLDSAPTIEEAAQRLGIDPSTLYRKRKRYGI